VIVVVDEVIGRRRIVGGMRYIATVFYALSRASSHGVPRSLAGPVRSVGALVTVAIMRGVGRVLRK
jgi:hypothetical protein